MSVTQENPAVQDDGDVPLRSSVEIQGNVLAPFKKDVQRFLFLNFDSSRVNARRWLAELLDDGVVSSTRRVATYNDAFKVRRARGESSDPVCWMAVSFTSAALVTLHGELASDLVGYDSFWQGAIPDREYGEGRRRSAAIIGDQDRGDPSGWAIDAAGSWPVDVLITIAADNRDMLNLATEKELERATARSIRVLAWQDCEKVKSGHEHFGFQDGISQPGIRGFTREETRGERLEAEDQAGSPIIAAGEFVLGRVPEPGSYPRARRPDPPRWMCDGSFQVFLRLRQDVDGWNKQTSDTQVKAIGRTTGGMPLEAPDAVNDFTFDSDPDGVRTPRSAHIRKVNPRDARFQDRTHRLLRRGVPFSTPVKDGPVVGDTSGKVSSVVEKGLVFNSFMASIEDQFEFVQRSWASNPEFPPVAADQPDVGLDPVIGASDALSVPPPEDAGTAGPAFGRFVWTTGAVYAFAPSIPALHRLAGADEIQGI